MEIKDFIQNFAEQFEDTELDVFAPETNYRKLEEWSSLIALSVLAMIDEEYDVEFRGDDIRNSDTVDDLYNIVLSRVE